MRLRLTLASVAILALVIACGCGKKEEPPAAKKAAAPEPGWPAISVQDAAVQYDLEEAHYHMRKGRVMAGSGWGSQAEAPIAQGYVQWAYEMQPDNDHAADAAAHLVRQAGSVLSPALNSVPRCRACGYAMPANVSTWRWNDDHTAKRTTECPNCLAEDSFPNSLILYCGKCRNMVAGTNAAGPYCANCNQSWEGLCKICGSCGKKVSILAHAGQRCPACKARWNREIPFGDPTAMKIAVNFNGNRNRNDDFIRVHMEVTPHGPKFTTSWFEPKPVQCSGYTAFTGQRCPNMTQSPADGGKAYCGVHRHQAERDAIIARGPVALGGGMAAGGAGGMSGPGMPGMSGGMGGAGGAMMPGMSGGGMPGAGPGGAGPGGKSDVGSKSKSDDKSSSAKAPKSADSGDE